MKTSGIVTKRAWVRVEWNSYSVAGLFFIIYLFKHVKDQINTIAIEKIEFTTIVSWQSDLTEIRRKVKK